MSEHRGKITVGIIVFVIVLLLVVVVRGRSVERASNRDPLAEALFMAQRRQDPMDSTAIMRAEHFGRGDETDLPYQSHNLRPQLRFEHLSTGSPSGYDKTPYQPDYLKAHKDFEHMQSETKELVDLLYA